MKKEKSTKTQKKKTADKPPAVGYHCADCLAGGFVPDEMAVTRDGRVVCFDCARWGDL